MGVFWSKRRRIHPHNPTLLEEQKWEAAGPQIIWAVPRPPEYSDEEEEKEWEPVRDMCSYIAPTPCRAPILSLNGY